MLHQKSSCQSGAAVRQKTAALRSSLCPLRVNPAANLAGFVRLGMDVEVPFSVQEVDIYDRAVKGETVEICGPALPDLIAGQVQVIPSLPRWRASGLASCGR